MSGSVKRRIFHLKGGDTIEGYLLATLETCLLVYADRGFKLISSAVVEDVELVVPTPVRKSKNPAVPDSGSIVDVTARSSRQSKK